VAGSTLQRIGAMVEELSHYVAEVSHCQAGAQLMLVDDDQSTAGRDDRMAIVRIMKSRDARASYFPADWFSNPAWDILLFLYCNHLEGHRLTVGDVGNGTGTRPTTTIRWLEILETEQMLDRHRCGVDSRRVYVSINDKGARAMRNYFDHVVRIRSD
jgi:DNA-binding MarR family transcriptional regulator